MYKQRQLKKEGETLDTHTHTHTHTYIYICNCIQSKVTSKYLKLDSSFNSLLKYVIFSWPMKIGIH